jgi:epoxyqueuosine reductase QueG
VDIERALTEFVEGRQIPIFGVASANGFEYALPGWKPRELMPRCNSVVVFGRPFAEHPPYVVNEKHIAADSWWEANELVSRQVALWRGEIVSLFDEFGLASANFGGYGLTSEPTFSYRLAQFEAGIGVYGRFGVCLNPDFGCYYTVGVLLTEAGLKPTGKGWLDNFSPCENCTKCAEVCPVRAIDPSKAPARGYDRDLCLRFILKMKGRHGASAKICARCFSVCPWGWRKQERHQLCKEGVQA